MSHNGLWLVVRPHQVLHHQASHLVVHEVPQQLVFARSLSKSSYSSSWELQVELKHGWMSKLPALPLWSIEMCFNPNPNQICYSPAQATYVYSKHAVQSEKLLAPSAWTRMMSVWKSMRHPTISTAAPRPGIIPVWAASIRHVAHQLWIFAAPAIGAVKYLQFWLEWYTVPYRAVITSKGISGRGDGCCDEVAGPSRRSPGRAWPSSMRTLRSSASISFHSLS